MNQKYTQKQIDEVLKAFIEVGYYGLDEEQQAIYDYVMG